MEGGGIRTLVLSLLLFSGIALGMSSFLGSLSSEYSIANVNNLNSMSVIDNITKTAENMESQLSQNMNPIELGYFIAIGAPLTALQMIFSTMVLFFTLISDLISSIVGFPSWLGTIITTSIVVFIIYEIISLVFRWRI